MQRFAIAVSLAYVLAVSCGRSDTGGSAVAPQLTGGASSFDVPSCATAASPFCVESVALDTSTGQLTVTFSRPVDLSSIGPASLSLVDDNARQAVPVEIAHATAPNDLLVGPSMPLAREHAYTLTLKSGPGGARDTIGGSLAADQRYAIVHPGQGRGTVPITQNIDPIVLVMLAAGNFTTCATRIDRTPFCWGANLVGAVGAGVPVPEFDSPRQVVRLNQVGTLCPSIHNSNCALSYMTGPATIWGWGQNQQGQLGIADPRDQLAPVNAVGVNPVVNLGAGAAHMCAVQLGGRVFCVGSNNFGQLGLGVFGGNTTAFNKAVVDPGPFSSVAGGVSHTCALKSDHTVWCWGDNSSGQLGDGKGGPNVLSATPVQVANLQFVRAIATGWSHSCVVKWDATAWCWGDNAHGQLGDNSRFTRTTPIQVVGLQNVFAIAANFDQTCALKLDGTAWCWGKNDFGQLGLGMGMGGGPDGLKPAQVPIPPAADMRRSAIVKIVVGNRYACGLRLDRTLWCWGTNAVGQFGDGTHSNLVGLSPIQSLFVP